jgi:hypothetical protein
MMAVVILALSLRAIFWVVEMRTRSAAHRQRAWEFALMRACVASFVPMNDGRWVDRYEDENTRLRDAWARRMSEKYWHLSDYPWLAVEPDPPPPERLAHPRTAFELPELEWNGLLVGERGSRPPAWTFLWTWPWGK